MKMRTHDPYPPPQTTSTAPRDHSHPSAAQASAAAYSAAQSADAHDTLAAVVHFHNSLAAGIQLHTLCPDAVAAAAVVCYRTCCRSGGLAGMRRAGVCCRSWLGAGHCRLRCRSGRPGGIVAARGGRCAGWGRRARACCSLGARMRCVVGGRTSFAQPCLHELAFYFSSSLCARTCSGSACMGSRSGLNPLLYAMVGASECCCGGGVQGSKHAADERGGKHVLRPSQLAGRSN